MCISNVILIFWNLARMELSKKYCISCIIFIFSNLGKCRIFKNNENPLRFLNMFSCLPSCLNEKACISGIILLFGESGTYGTRQKVLYSFHNIDMFQFMEMSHFQKQ